MTPHIYIPTLPSSFGLKTSLCFVMLLYRNSSNRFFPIFWMIGQINSAPTKPKPSALKFDAFIFKHCFAKKYLFIFKMLISIHNCYKEIHSIISKSTHTKFKIYIICFINILLGVSFQKLYIFFLNFYSYCWNYNVYEMELEIINLIM